jgi:uroporphyrinogen decarboxylase
MCVPVNCGPCPKIERSIIQEDDEFVVFIDEWGIKRRNFKHRESMSEFIEFPVKNREDWERFKEERLNPDSPERLDGNWMEQCEQWTLKDCPIQLGHYPEVGLFGGLRWLLGDEECLIAFYTMPDLVHDIMDHLTSLYLTVFEKVVKIVQVDVIHIWEDMCGRQGPLISPAHWDEFMGPNYRRIKAFADTHNIPIISVDTDGNPDLIIPSMMRAGVNYLYPMEVAAGCDVNILRDKYPTLGMMGGIDKRVLAKGKKAIEEELKRIIPAEQKGRYIPDLDHLVPDDVSWDNYCHFAEHLKSFVGKS